MAVFDSELPSIAIKNLRQQRLRSYLTLSGIVIGIVIIAALISIGQSMQVSIENQFVSMGMNTLFLEPGSEESLFTTAIARTIKESDLRIVESIPGVDEVVPFYEVGGTVKRKGEEAGIMILGINPSQLEILRKIGYINIKDGREIKKGDKFNMIIYQGFAENAFDEELKLRERVKIGDYTMRIIGISKPYSLLGFSISTLVIVTEDAAKQLFGAEDPLEVAITVTEKSRIGEVKEKIETELEKAHGEKDFYLLSAEEMLEAAGIVLVLVQIVLLGIASISLIVGGVGITNTMLMAVIERTREIGLMKAVGATNTRIMSLFLTEALFIGAVGGAIGITIGLLIAYAVTSLATASGFQMPFIFNPTLIGGLLVFSSVVGVIAGYLPAKRAASLDPVEALHYE
jgi:putative ABC transport system permease protein